MPNNLIEQFNQFALAINSVDEATFFDMEGFFYELVRHGLGANYYEVCIGNSNQSGRGLEENLQVLWCSKSEYKNSHPRLLNPDSSYFSQKSYVYLTGRPLWLTAKNKAKLLIESHKDEIESQWKEHQEIPDYRDFDEPGNSKSSIVVPLKFLNRRIGVFVLEFPNVLLFNAGARDEIVKLASTLSILIERKALAKNNELDTLNAFKSFRKQAVEDLAQIILPGIKNKVFFAYPKNSDERVIAKIVSTINNRFSDSIELIKWEDVHDLGNITQTIVEAVKSAKFGICYLSERVEEEGAKFPYRDNLNVLFEAGMMHILQGSNMLGWLPIRESDELSGTPPYDLIVERRITLERSEEGNLNDNALQVELENFLGETFEEAE